MTVCAVNGCHSSSEKHKKDCNITFHVFPCDPIIAASWIDKIRRNRNESSWKPTKNTKICSLHFDDNVKYVTKGGLCRLRKGAIPTKALPVFSTEEKHSSNNLHGDDIQTSQERNQPQPGSSGCDTNKNPNLSTPTTPLSSELDSIFDTPKKASLRKQLRKNIFMQRKHSRKIKTLKQNISRLKKRNATLKIILVDLRKKRYINNDISNILSENVFAADLFNSLSKKIRKGKKRPMPKYTPEFRKFCLTLHFYSPRAYLYVRKTFNTCLPHPKTIYNWYRTINGSPGFTHESFDILKSKVLTSTQKKLICTLVADEMAIRPQNIKGGHGHVDIGTGTSECITLATEAYVFILVCLNEHWKIPLGYFLVHGLTGGQKANLIKICLTKCEEVGVKVVALTFDAHSTNISTMELLGCRLKDPENIKSTFHHPAAVHDVAVFLDSSHMIKLVRNHFEDKKEFLDQDENKVDWEFLTKLNALQEKEGLHIANKLTRKHLEFRNSVMNVKLAAQLLSRSVAVALQFCREVLKLDDFKNSEATENFIMIFNNLFDIFNTRRLTQYGFCHPLSSANKKEIFDFLDRAKKYIIDLQIKTTRKRKYNEKESSINVKIKSFQSALTVKCSPGFKGLLICIESLKYLYNTLVEDTKELKYITTYRLSQDHIELLFGSIRMHSGHNDNPNALQFKGSYRKLLCHMELQVGATGNCVPLEDIPVLTCSSALTCINNTSFSERFDDENKELNEHLSKTPIPNDVGFDITSSSDDPNCKNHIVGYIAGYVVRYLTTRVKCKYCIDNMLAKQKLWFHKLVIMRDQGGLVYAAEEVYSICSIADTVLRHFLRDNLSEKEIILRIMSRFIGRRLFPTEHINSHYHDTNLTRLIVERYVRIRLFYEAKKENIQRFVSSKRQLFRKQLQLQGY